MKKNAKKRLMALLTTLAMLLTLVGCNGPKTSTGNETEYNFEDQFIKLSFVGTDYSYEDNVEFRTYTPDFKKDPEVALKAYKESYPDAIEPNKYYFPGTQNYLLVTQDMCYRMVNKDTESCKLVDAKFFKSDANKLVMLGFKAIDNCRVPVTVTIMEDGTILKEETYDNVESVDTIGVEGTILMKAQNMTLIQYDDILSFYRFGEELINIVMPEKVSGSYSSVFLADDGKLYVTLINSSTENPWIKHVEVDKNVTGLTGKTFDQKDGYSFPIYTKEVDGEEIEYTAIMDMETYNSYVYTMYPSIGDTASEPNTEFEVIQPKDYVPSAE